MLTGAPSIRISPSSGSCHTGEQTYERGFARAVFTEQDMDLAGMELERHAIQRHNPREALGDPPQRRHRDRKPLGAFVDGSARVALIMRVVVCGAPDGSD